jgi:hypothetical protein
MQILPFDHNNQSAKTIEKQRCQNLEITKYLFLDKLQIQTCLT